MYKLQSEVLEAQATHSKARVDELEAHTTQKDELIKSLQTENLETKQAYADLRQTQIEQEEKIIFLEAQIKNKQAEISTIADKFGK